MAQVGVIMGSISDWDTMEHACNILEVLNVPYEKDVISAHRTPDDMFAYAKTARERGLKAIIAGAGVLHISLEWLHPKRLCQSLVYQFKAKH